MVDAYRVWRHNAFAFALQLISGGITFTFSRDTQLSLAVAAVTALYIVRIRIRGASSWESRQYLKTPAAIQPLLAAVAALSLLCVVKYQLPALVVGAVVGFLSMIAVIGVYDESLDDKYGLELFVSIQYGIGVIIGAVVLPIREAWRAKHPTVIP